MQLSDRVKLDPCTIVVSAMNESQLARSTAFRMLRNKFATKAILQERHEICYLSMQVRINRMYLHNSDICQNVGEVVNWRILGNLQLAHPELNYTVSEQFPRTSGSSAKLMCKIQLYNFVIELLIDNERS